jgi:hypothetical protein
MGKYLQDVRAVILLVSLMMFCDLSALAKVAGVSFERLVRISDVIVVARVDRVSKPAVGKKWATASVIETWKGVLQTNVTFLASPTWTCDVSEANKGETVVLFLVQDKNPKRYVLAVSGRGRMPVYEVDGKRSVTFWSEVRLLKDTPAVAGREPEREFVESIELQKLRELVGAALEAGSKSK